MLFAFHMGVVAFLIMVFGFGKDMGLFLLVNVVYLVDLAFFLVRVVDLGRAWVTSSPGAPSVLRA
ncbi:MAG: hypothetical protein V3U79_08135 [Dehalococcoidia bacterium]